MHDHGPVDIYFLLGDLFVLTEASSLVSLRTFATGGGDLEDEGSVEKAFQSFVVDGVEDDDSTGAGCFSLLDFVNFSEVLPLVGGFQLLCKFIIADCTGIDYGILGKEILVIVSMIDFRDTLTT